MTRREQLQEQYEDAFFALLMDDLAVDVGEKAKAENKMLMSDSRFAVPEAVRRRCLKKIKKHFAYCTTQNVVRFSGKLISKVAVLALIATLLFTTAFAVSESVRIATLNFVSATFYDHKEIRIVEKDNVSSVSSDSFIIDVGWMPDGYELSVSGGEWPDIWKEYKGLNGNVITIEMFSLNSTDVLSVDTEDAKIDHIQINGVDAEIIEKDCTQIVIPVENHSIIMVSSDHKYVPIEDMIKIAENINF